MVLNKIASFVKNNIIFTIQPILTRLVTFVVLQSYTEYLKIEDFGVLELILTLGVFFKTLISMGTTSSYWKFIDRKGISNQKEITFNILLIPFICSIPTFLLILGYILLFDPTLQEYLLLVLLYCLSETISTVYSISNLIVRKYQMQKKFLSISILYFFGFLIGNYIFVIYLELNIYGVVLNYIVTNTILFIFCYLFIIKEHILFSINFLLIKKILSFSYPLVISNILFISLGMSDRFLINRFDSVKSVGLYSYINKISNISRILIIDMGLILLNPYRFKIYNSKNGVSTYSKLNIIVKIAILILPYPLYFFTKYFGQFFTKNVEYLENFEYSFFLIIANLFYALYYLNISGLMFKNKTKYVAYIIGVTLCFNITANYLLIPIYGYLAACVSNMFSFYFMHVLSYYISNKYYKLSVPVVLTSYYNIVCLFNIFCYILIFTDIITLRYINEFLFITNLIYLLYVFFKYKNKISLKSVNI